MSRVLAVLAVWTLAPLAAAAEPARGPVDVCVVAATIEGTLPGKDELKARRDAAKVLSETFTRVSKQLNAQHGKDIKKWPPEARTALFDAFDAQQQAWVRSIAGFIAPDRKELEDSVRNVQESFRGKGFAGRKEHVGLVERCDDAAIVLELVGRTGGSKLVVSDKFMLFNLRPGPKLPAGAFDGIEPDWGWAFDHFAWTHRYKADAPYFQFEVWDDQRWRDVANWISAHLDHFIKDHYDALKPALE